MSEAYASCDAHAYVDNCLSPADRAAFEAGLRRDAKLRARVEAWDAQNEAIRLAFGAAPRPRAIAPTLARPSNENNVVPAPATPPSRIAALAQPLRERASAARSTLTARRTSHWRLGAVGGLAFAVGLLGLVDGPSDPREALLRRAGPALRATSAFADTRLDFASNDPRAVSAWLAPRFARLDAKRLAPPGWVLLGVRLVPGLVSAAALVLFEDALGGKAALILEPGDALPDLPPIGRHDPDQTVVAGATDGFIYAAVGPNHSGISALIPSAPRD
jgi:anti-sigma factor RsiW